MLNDRGKNFVIKYEGSFKSRSADCLVLQHVQHDRPEVLIDHSHFNLSFG